MKEQSHKREMAAAVRGDFERLRDRGVASTISVVAEGEPGDESPPPEVSPHDPREKRSVLSRVFRLG